MNNHNTPSFNVRRPYQVIGLAIIIIILFVTWVPYTPPPSNDQIEPATETIVNTNVETLPNKKAFTIVTGASANHFCPIKAFIYNLNSTLDGMNARIIVYDLGMTRKQRKIMTKLQNDGFFDELRVFKFSSYPSFWNITVARGEYGWKPAIIAEVSEDYPGIITWLDAGTLATRRYFEKLDFLLKKSNGFLSPRSSGNMKNWTHPGVYEYYDDDPLRYEDLPNCNGAVVAFDTTKVQNIIDEWYSCALNKDCIAPPGSSRANHRQDQAILTYLAARDEHYCILDKESIWVYTHQDHSCSKVITFYEKLNNINIRPRS